MDRDAQAGHPDEANRGIAGENRDRLHAHAGRQERDVCMDLAHAEREEIEEHHDTQTMKLSDLKPTQNNPRTITDAAKKGLATSLEMFGDISGIVYNTKLDRLVAGHQRVQVLRERYGDLSVTRKRDGTGQIETPEGTFAVRFVEWDEAKTDAALVTANNTAIQGDWTDGLRDMTAGLNNSLGKVFDDLMLGDFLTEKKEATLQPIKEMPAPEMAWVLIAIPTVAFGEINQHVEAIAKNAKAIVETTVTA